ncbi:hypothetical protein FLONG3_10022 [Fusarium longipes]|uniref:Uncharacterized protein n=1 Tax=Fusarium longipes TaxID=694270 RepID=A0A395RST3_9HYPO|nr:hypothetical protein FLONG3_10022 [Fusarium longipes]
MNPPSDPGKGHPDNETLHPRTITAQRPALHVRQTRHLTSASREISQLPESLPQMQPPETNGRAYLKQEHQNTFTYQGMQEYAPSTLWAYQGSHGPQQYDDPSDAQDRVTLPGHHHPSDDPHRRTASFVGFWQQYNTGTRYAPYADNAEQRGVTYAAGTITRFETQYGAYPNVTAQGIKQVGTSWPYPQRINPDYCDYPPTVEYASHNGNSSRPRC